MLVSFWPELLLTLAALGLALLPSHGAAMPGSHFMRHFSMALLRGGLLARCISPTADLVFHASDSSLRGFTTWIGALAWVIQSCLLLSATVDLANAMRAFLKKDALLLMASPLLADGFTALWDKVKPQPQPATGWLIAAGLAVVWLPQHVGLPLLWAVPAVACAALSLALLWGLWRVEQSLGGRPSYSLFPPPLRVAITLALLCLLWAPLRCESVAHLLTIWKAMLGAGSVLDTAPMLRQAVAPDRNLFLIALLLAVCMAVRSPWSWSTALRPLRRVLLGLVCLGSAYLITASQQPVVSTALQPLPYLRQVQLAKNGDLYDTSTVTALTGRGTMPPQGHWLSHGVNGSGIRETMLSLTQKLKEQGSKLMIVPLPMELTVYPEQITGSRLDEDEAPVFQLNEASLQEELVAAGAEVVDITDSLLGLKSRFQPTYLEDDEKLRPDLMERVAEAIADTIRKEHPKLIAETALLTEVRAAIYTQQGDFALRAGLLQRPAESYTLAELPQIKPDTAAPILLLGDATATHYGTASFAQRLAFHVGHPIDVSVSADAPDQAVAALAQRYADDLQQKKVVVWLLSAKEMVMADRLAYRMGRRWGPLQFNAQTRPAEPVQPLVTK